MKQRFANLSRTELVMMLLAVLYIVSPIDILPEALMGPLGLTDDLAAAMLIGTTMLRAREGGKVVVAEPVEPQSAS